MATPRFCDACGAALLAGARFCEACGAAVPQDAPARGAPPASKPAESATPRRPAPAPGDALPGYPRPTPDTPSAKRTATGPLLLLAALVLAGAVGVWYALRPAQAPQRSEPVPIQAERRPAPPAQPVPAAQLPAERPPARPAIARSDIEALKSAVLAANRAHVEAIFASADPPPELRIRLNQAIRELGQALYRFHVEGGHGDLDSARQEMRAFLEGLDQDGLGLSEPAIDEGVASVAP